MNKSLLLALSLVGCSTENDAITGTQSLRVEILAPTTTGTVDQRLPDSQRTLTVNLTAVDANGDIDTTFADPIRVYAQFLGTLTPDLDQMPLTTIPMVDGQANGSAITLPSSVLGPTTLWFDNGTGLGAAYEYGQVTGTSDTLWYRDPFIADLQTPRDEMDVDALSTTPLTDKQISVSASRYGARGRLVVTSVFSQGYTVSDVECADASGTPPCVADHYDHVMVFTFSAARDQFGRLLEVGRMISKFNGGLSEFNGLTEVGFPRTYAPETDAEAPAINLGRVPAPVRFAMTWFEPLSDPAGRINFERNEAGAIEIIGARVCPTDEEYDTYKQWKVDPSGVATPAICNGNRVISVITQGTDFTTDPKTLVGRVLPRLVGIVRPVSIGSFNVWIIYPRGASDVTL
ncbi:MAG: hypothetical protein H0T42_13160 [Deltaproteobacteria bacterium]|nr:hypothetical protein [Deltaproteobacteria bacterium]